MSRDEKPGISRRSFLVATAAAGTTQALSTGKQVATADERERKIRLGVIGCGGRGQWIAKSIFMRVISRGRNRDLDSRADVLYRLSTHEPAPATAPRKRLSRKPAE